MCWSHSAEYDFNYKFKALVIENSKIVDNSIKNYNLLKSIVIEKI